MNRLNIDYIAQTRDLLNIELKGIKDKINDIREQATLYRAKISINEYSKETHNEMCKKYHELDREKNIIIGQLSALNHLLNYDAPLVRGLIVNNFSEIHIQ